MTLQSHRWRRCLMGTAKDIYELRTIKLSPPVFEDLPVDEIDRDLKRTFPLEMFYTHQIDKIRNVLLWYAFTNPAVPYCQCFSFISFVMYRCFYEGDKRHAMIDTYYGLHKIILLIKPLLPMSDKDGGPLKFAGVLRSVLLLDVMKHSRKLYNRLKQSMVIKFIILSGFSSLYLNWFPSDDGLLLLDYIICEKASTMFQRLINFTVAIFLVNKQLFLGFDDMICLEMLREKELLNFHATLFLAKHLK